MESVIQNWFVFRIAVAQYDELQYVLMIIPFVLFLELPLYLVNWLGVLRYNYQKKVDTPVAPLYFPRVTRTITCYSEGKAVQNTVLSLLEQIYSGHIAIIAAVDGVKKNLPTYHALKECENARPYS